MSEEKLPSLGKAQQHFSEFPLKLVLEDDSFIAATEALKDRDPEIIAALARLAHAAGKLEERGPMRLAIAAVLLGIQIGETTLLEKLYGEATAPEPNVRGDGGEDLPPAIEPEPGQ